MNEDFHKKLMSAVQERLRAIAGNEEKLVEAWVAQHGFKPDECEIVRQDMQNGTERMWVEKRGEFVELHQLRAKLARVEALLPKWVDDYGLTARTCTEDLALVLQPSDAAVDPKTKTGDKPGADSDDTSEVGESSDKSHLSSVVEQRFRKPLDSQAAEQASPPEPVETRLAADGGMSVDEALQYVADHEAGKPVFMKDWMALTTFAAEVRRLREERDLFRTASEAAETRLELNYLKSTLLICDVFKERDRLREQRDLFRTASEAAELRIVELREQVTLMGAALKQQDEEFQRERQDWRAGNPTAARVVAAKRSAEAKLARVEALPDAFERRQTELHDARMDFTANEASSMVEAALRDEPQPEREPKLPYNGY